MKEYTDYFPYKSVTLEKMGIGFELKIAREIVDDRDTYIGFRIRGYIWSQDAGRAVTFRYPSDWWQAVKERFAPRWFLDRYPVVYTNKTFQVKATYPDLVIQNHEPIMRLIESTYTQPAQGKE